MAEVLFGKVNPSGKLAETFIKDESQCPARTGVNFALNGSVAYDEGVFVGYRYYDTYDVDVNFCFGHGLSYSSFQYSNLQVLRQSDNPVEEIGESEPAGTEEVTFEISVSVENTGEMTGKEIVQVYVAPKEESEYARPVHQLKAFAKVALESGEKKNVKCSLSRQDFAVFDVNVKDFVVVPGKYEIQVGSSARDIRLTTIIDVK